MNVLARPDPTVKLAVVFAISLLLILIVDPVTPSLFLAVAIGVALAGGTRPATILRALVPLSILGVGFVWSNAVFAATQGPATWTIGPIHASEPGLRFGLAIAIRGMAIGLFSLAFVWTTDPTDRGVPLGADGRMFLPFFTDEYAQVRLARRVRGAVPRGPLGRAREAVGELVTLLSDATRRATRIAIAMDARAFAAATRRTYYRETRLTWDDALFVLAAAVTTTALLVLSAWLGSLRTVLG